MAEELPPTEGQDASKSPDPDPQPQSSADAASSSGNPADSNVENSGTTEPADGITNAGSDSPKDSVEAVMDATAAAQDAIDELLKQAAFEDPSAVTMGTGSSVDHVAPTHNIDLPNFQQVLQDVQVSSIDLLRDVELNVKIELGRTRMLVEDVLKLGDGSVVELDKLAGDPVDVFVNDRLVARGEVLVLNDNFCVRVAELLAAMPA